MLGLAIYMTMQDYGGDDVALIHLDRMAEEKANKVEHLPFPGCIVRYIFDDGVISLLYVEGTDPPSFEYAYEARNWEEEHTGLC